MMPIFSFNQLTFLHTFHNSFCNRNDLGFWKHQQRKFQFPWLEHQLISKTKRRDHNENRRFFKKMNRKGTILRHCNWLLCVAVLPPLEKSCFCDWILHVLHSSIRQRKMHFYILDTASNRTLCCVRNNIWFTFGQKRALEGYQCVWKYLQ